MNSDLKTYSHIFKQEGTAQNERYLATLRPDHVAIDDRKLQDLILYAQRFSRNLAFVDAENNPVGSTPSWEAFYQSDPVVMLSNIAARNAQEIKRVYDFLDQNFQQEITVEKLVPVVEYTRSRYAKINEWYGSSAPDSALRQDLQLYIRSYLSKKLTELRQIIMHVNDLRRNQAIMADFPPEAYPKEVWGGLTVEDQGFGKRVLKGNSEGEQLLSASLLLREIFDAAFHVMENTIANCHDYLEETIRTKQNHPPHIALLIAFLELYGYLQQDLNKLPQRHLRYYYEEVLRIKLREAIPDQAFVVFELVKGFEKYEIKKGVALSAGKDRQNKELVYEIDKEVVLHPAQVTELQTLTIVRDRQQRIVGYAADTLLKHAEKVSADPFGRIFGSRKTKTTVGLAIASAQLYLARGLRNVTVSFQSAEEIPFVAFDQSLFKLLLTGEKGWLSSDAKDMIVIHSLKRNGSHTLDLRFTVSIAQPSAIVAFDDTLHEGNFTTKSPVMQLLLNYPSARPDATPQEKNDYESKVAQLHFLQGMRVVDVRIEVEVGDVQAPVSFDGVRDLVLQNHEALLDVQKPFYPFSALPKVGSSFYIGCNDLYYKDIERLSLSFEWMLPDNFSKHYASYLPPYNTNPFTATLSILNDKQWKKLSDVAIIDVLAADPKFRSIKVDSSQTSPVEQGSNAETAVSKFDVSKADGTLKLKLNYPDFGHGIYPQLLTSSILKMTSSQEDYVRKIKKELHDSVISIKVPDRVNRNVGSVKTVVELIAEILKNVKDDTQARAMLIKSLSPIVRTYNDITTLADARAAGSTGKTPAGEAGSTMLVNDDNFIERRIFSFLRKVKLIRQTEHFDRDKDTVEEVVDSLKAHIDDEIDEEEVMKLILDETSSIIHQTVVNLADKLIASRRAGIPKAEAIKSMLDEEFAEANEDINDSLAKKIATFLLMDEVPQPPYTPLINSISLSYRSARRCVAGEDQFFQITPFGVIEISPFQAAPQSVEAREVDRVNTGHLLPSSFVTEDGTDRHPVSLFFMGIRNLVSHQLLSLLFQFAEGTRKLDKAPPVVNWWSLSNSHWEPLAADHLVSDTTYGLQTTGILQIAVPSSATNQHILFGESNVYWLCASVEQATDAFPGLIMVAANATTATFKNQDNDPMHGALPLPANKITRLVEMNPAIKKVAQPVASMQGQVKEREQEYFTRVSERLRHKSRAISNWDYERLVLEHFPTVFKVKCLNNYYAGTSVAGHVTIVPICDLRNRSYTGADILLPKASDMTLKSIEKFLSSKSSPFVKIHAINPQLDQVLITCKVKFYKGVDQGFYLQKLNEELVDYLTPWASGEQESVSFSAKVYASSVINFIDKRSYVDYVVDLSMNQYTEDAQGNPIFCRTDSQSISLVETQFTAGHAVLVSAPRHRIDLME